jgi:hypothetical protein
MCADTSHESPIAGHPWNEERLYVLHSIEDLRAELLRQADQASAARAKIEDRNEREAEKLAKDLKAAHDKIRALENGRILQNVKIWLMTLVLSAAGAVVFELIKAWLAKK